MSKAEAVVATAGTLRMARWKLHRPFLYSRHLQAMLKVAQIVRYVFHDRRVKRVAGFETEYPRELINSAVG